jgi:aminotransferase EvaB
VREPAQKIESASACESEKVSYDKINNLSLHTGSIFVELEDAARRVIGSGWFALGPEVQLFEESFARWCGVAHCSGVANGTDALELALRSVGVHSGSEVILAANAGFYSTTAILAIGATPVFADVQPDSLNLDPLDVKHRITSRTRAIVTTHLYGLMCDMPAFRELADRSGVALVEDCAQAHGAVLEGKKAGAWGDVAAFSFYPTKNLGALGDAGAVVTADSAVFRAVTELRQYGWGSRYRVDRAGGRNSRLDEMQAAFLNVKLRYLEDWVERRRAIARVYGERISHSEILLPVSAGNRHACHLYVVRASHRDALRNHLRQHGIASEVHYPVLDYEQPAVSQLGFSRSALTQSERAVREILSLPCYPELQLKDVEVVADCVNAWAGASGK